MNAIIAPKAKEMADFEWEARVNLAACYRLVARNGWDDLIYTHISAAVPGPKKHFLINPYGMMFGEITASSLVKVDLDGNIASDTAYEINPASFTIHSVAAAYVRMFYLERACQMQIAAQAGGAELNLLPQTMCDRVFEQVAKGYSRMGELDWPPLLRLLDREDPSYKN